MLTNLSSFTASVLGGATALLLHEKKYMVVKFHPPSWISGDLPNQRSTVTQTDRPILPARKFYDIEWIAVFFLRYGAELKSHRKMLQPWITSRIIAPRA
ncbi:hypothetical protein DEU56DRAFT_583291 [Suillus clintonianus]|uniref:uncharacterized protein n=1 Tax=Suillus clintonianus TaxID=1904413 RepID=UPI001B86806D|nr:uncharacterized protein DEU56DRAFT_583291 [Suillus clintonianus]KAG2150969.1 hypothetical protein DEU56DRAFT_583291 [Suillus clintonianus]